MKKEKSTVVLCALAIRKELRARFTNVSFSVVSQRYANGDSVTVFWKDGPSVATIRTILEKYQIGNFDAMADGYRYSNIRHDLYQTKLISYLRTFTEATIQKIISNEPGWENIPDDKRGVLLNGKLKRMGDL